jgi:hypothetical protein
MSEPNEERVHYRDRIPYEAPESLDQLRGPSEGVITLPAGLNEGENSRADLSTPAGRYKLVKVVVQEGTVAQQIELLNADVLRAVWPELTLPPRCRQLWETRFPQLSERRQ